MTRTRSVALIGNMNNNFFTLGRYLRDGGCNATLYILPYDSAHFQPEADTFQANPGITIKRLSWGNPYELGSVTAQEIRNEFGSFDFIIGCGTAPAYMTKAGLKLDLFIPYGSDLYHYPFFNLFSPAKVLKYAMSFFNKKEKATALQKPSKPQNIKGYIPFVRAQRKGIRASVVCAVPTSGTDIYGIALKRLNYRNKHYSTGSPIVYAPEFGADVISKAYSLSQWYEKFNKIRSESDLVVFHNCRHCWKNEPDPFSFKGNDRLLRGFAGFLKTYPGRASIITFEYGSDVEESKKLADELGIAKHIHWFPVMPRKELIVGMSVSNLVAGNLGDQSWSVYGVVFESMVMAKPVMHHRDDNLYPKETLYPMMNAYTPEMVQKALQFAVANPSELKSMGEEANGYYNSNFIEGALKTFLNLINNKKI